MENILNDSYIIQLIISNINELSNYTIEIDETKKNIDAQIDIIREGIININFSREEMCEKFRDLISESDVRSRIKEIYDTIVEAAIYRQGSDSDNDQEQYTNDEIRKISKLTADDLNGYFNNSDELSVITDEIISDPELLLEENEENHSYAKIAYFFIQIIVIRYKQNKGDIKDYNDFLSFLQDEILYLTSNIFVQCRRQILRLEKREDLFVEDIIYHYMRGDFPTENLLDCELRRSVEQYIDERLIKGVGNQYAKKCIEYIINHSLTEKNNFVDKCLHSIAADSDLNLFNQDIISNSFAPYCRKLKDDDSDEKSQNSSENEEKINVDVPVNSDDPSTWNIEMMKKVLSKTEYDNTVNEIINSNDLFWPKANNIDYKSYFIKRIQEKICEHIRNDLEFNDSTISKQQLIDKLEEQIEASTEFSINVRKEILDTYYSGKEPKIDLIINRLNNKLKKELNTKTSYLTSTTSFYKRIYDSLNSDQSIKNRIRISFLNYFKNTYKDKLIYSSDDTDTKNISEIYIRFFPKILLEDLYKKDIKMLNNVFSKDKIKIIIDAALEKPDVYFLPKDENIYNSFTQLLIQNQLSDFQKIINEEQITSIKESGLNSLFGTLRKRYDLLLKGDVNVVARRIRRNLFLDANGSTVLISDPLTTYIIYKLFPDLNDVNLNIQSKLYKSLTNYVNTDKMLFWKNLKGYIEKITSSVFHTNYSMDNPPAYNSIYVQAINEIQANKNFKFDISYIFEKISEHEEKQLLEEKVQSEESLTPSENEDILSDTKLNVLHWTYDQLNEYTNNKLQDIANEEISFLPEQYISQFCNMLSKKIYQYFRRDKIETKQELLDKIKNIINKYYPYKDLLELRKSFLQKLSYKRDPFVANINLQFPDLIQINTNCDLYNDIIAHVFNGLLSNSLQNILNKYVVNDKNTVFQQKFPLLFNNDLSKSIKNDSSTEKNLIETELTEKDLIEKKDLVETESTENDLVKVKPVKKDLIETEPAEEKDLSERKDLIETKPTKKDLSENKLQDNISLKRRTLIIDDNLLSNQQFENNIRLKHDLSENQNLSIKNIDIPFKSIKTNNKVNKDLLMNQQLEMENKKTIILDNYSLEKLVNIIGRYNELFNLENEISKAIIGHIESFQGESYKRIFMPLFEGEYAKKLPDKNWVMTKVLPSVQLNSLIANDRNRFATVCKIFLYNISNNKYKFVLTDIYNQTSIFTKQLRNCMLQNKNIIRIVNQRLCIAFEKYYNAYVNNKLDTYKYNKSFVNLLEVDTINDSKGDIHQLKDSSIKEKILVVNDQVYKFNNKSFTEYLHDLNIQESIFNYATGYIINNCVFLEPLTNISEEEIANLLKSKLYVKKIYLTINKDNDILTERRLARKIIKKRKK